MALSWKYAQHAHTPYWGPVTAQANFCEEDYVLTGYIAEVINTVSNLTYLLYAYHGIKSNASHKDAILRNLPYLGIAGVGLGSSIFHATLKNYTQWLDDLSMLIATATVLHRVFTFDKSLSITVTSGLLITAIMAAFSTWHCITDELTMHSVLFGLMIAAIGLKTRSIISARVSNPAIKAQVFKLCTWGSIIFVTGFAIWNVDNAICGKLTQWKRVVGMPWSFLLELHGWWHVFTGAGAYIFIALVEYLTSEDAGKPLGGRFAFPAAWIVDGEAGKAEGNGHAYSNGMAKANGLNGNANGNAMVNGSNGFANGKANGKANGNGNAKKTI